MSPAKADPIANAVGSGPASAEADGFQRVHNKRGSESVVDQVREAIFSGRYKPGDRLPTEREMADIFGVSRNGCREAMRALESSGLVEMRLGVHGGAFVRPGDPSTVARSLSDLASLGALAPEALLEARILLTCDVLRLACERATPADLQAIEDDIELIERRYTEPSAERTAHIVRFYHLLAAASHNDVLIVLTDALAQAVNVRLMRGGPKVDPNLGKLRRRILRQVRQGDADAAMKEITRHLKKLEASMVAIEATRAR